MALYTEACTIDAGLSESFEVKVGLHQGVSTESTVVCCCHGC